MLLRLFTAYYFFSLSLYAYIHPAPIVCEQTDVRKSKNSDIRCFALKKRKKYHAKVIPYQIDERYLWRLCITIVALLNQFGRRK